MEENKKEKNTRPVRPATVDIFVIKDGNVLLIKRASEPFKGEWMLPGGFIEIDEDAATAAKREAKEETGIDVELIGIIGVYSDPARDSRGTVSIAYLAIPLNDTLKTQENETSEVKWYPIDKLPKLGCDHEKIVADAMSYLNQDSCGENCDENCQECGE